MDNRSPLGRFFFLTLALLAKNVGPETHGDVMHESRNIQKNPSFEGSFFARLTQRLGLFSNSVCEAEQIIFLSHDFENHAVCIV